MSLNESNLSLRLLTDPINIQKLVLDDVQSRLGGDYEIVDVNNTWAHLVETAANLTAHMAMSTENAINATNALRAQTTEDLARNMSDYDYVNQYSTPAMTHILLTLDKKYITDNALSYNENYKKVIIPADTTFTIGNLIFGIYYPIEIRINKTTGTPLVVFDASEENSLHVLKQNIIPFTEQSYMNMDLLVLKIPVYQFTKSYVEEDLVPLQGFANKYTYTERFFATRMFTTVNGKKVELHQTLSPGSYDPYEPTARIRIEPETKTFYVNIPQIYFTSKLMGTKLTMEVYTSKGALDVDISAIPPESILCNFNLNKNSSPFSKILSMIPTVIVAAANNTVVGGSNGYDFEELRRRVINNAFHTSVLVTPMDMEKYFGDAGFRIVRYMDNLTNLIYFGYRVLTDKFNSVVPSMTGAIDFKESLVDTVSTMLKNVDGTYTFLPKTLYKYEESSQTCVPVSDVDIAALANLTKLERIAEFNKTIYTKSPFHMRLIPDGRYSKVGSYNLMNPSVTDLMFSRENPNITAQMVATAGAILHLNEGAGGYRLQLMVNKSSDLLEIPEEDIYVYLYTEAVDGMSVGTRLTFKEKFGNEYIYETILETDYCISRDHHLNLTSLHDESTTWDHFVKLESTYNLVFMVNRNHFPTAISENSLYTGVENSLKNSHLVVLRQTCVINLGYSLEDVVYNDINLSWTGRQYLTHPIDVPMTYPYDVYSTNPDGTPIIEMDPESCEVILTPLHQKGEVILDDFGQPVMKHRKGDIRYGEDGQPILLHDRVQVYYINALMIDAKIYLSEHPKHVSYRDTLPQTLESYFATLRSAADLLLERDLLYFRPIRTLGSSQFNIGDGIVLTMPLNMSISLRCFVGAEVAADTQLKETITESIISLIEPEIQERQISLTDLASLIKEKIDYVEFVDVLGINDDTSLQTLTIVEEGVQPSVAQELYLTKNNLLSIRKSIDIEFTAM